MHRMNGNIGLPALGNLQYSFLARMAVPVLVLLNCFVAHALPMQLQQPTNGDWNGERIVLLSKDLSGVHGILQMGKPRGASKRIQGVQMYSWGVPLARDLVVSLGSKFRL